MPIVNCGNNSKLFRKKKSSLSDSSHIQCIFCFYLKSLQMCQGEVFVAECSMLSFMWLLSYFINESCLYVSSICASNI